MDRETKNRVLDNAITLIKDYPDSTATLVNALEYVFSQGYAFGLNQGHRDNENTKGNDQ